MTDTEDLKCPEHTRCAEDVIGEEKQYIKEDPDRESSRGDDFWGLAISGGGIRSASFGLGVMQALVAHPAKSILKGIDYLSTVSGGGYIGSALTWFLHKGLPDGTPAGTEPKNFPLGHIGAGSRTDPEGNLILDYIRQHGSYLTPGKGLNAISLFGIVVRSMFVSLFVYLSLLTILVVCLKTVGLFDALSIKQIPGTHFTCPLTLVSLIWLAIIIAALLALSGLVFSIRTHFSRGSVKGYMRSIAGQRRVGRAWTAVFGLLLIGSLPYAMGGMEELWTRAAAAGSSASIGALIGFLEYRKAQKGKALEKAGALSTLRITIAAFALIYGLLLAAYILSPMFENPWCFAGLVVVTGVFGYFVNLNYVGFHRMYRNRLMETFMPNARTVKGNQWGPATEADGALLENMCKTSRRPYHLINTNIVLVDSPNAKFRGRGGDSFLLSPLYCGSDATCYRSTKDYMKRGSRGMTLASAMAISAAAVNPDTGVAGEGVMRNRLVSTLLGLLNLRLGYWAKNPRDERPLPFPPNFLIPGLSGDVLGRGLTEQKKAIELTDGGHFENLALYELIRRKARVIIACDAGADPDFLFGDLANAVERVRVDFGVKIRFDPNYNLDALLPGSATDGHLAEKYTLAERGFAIADIAYPDGTTPGKLIYLKTTLTKGLPADIYGYKSADRTFPDQTTSDQFFDEKQLEAYRELGYQLTQQMLQSKEAKKIL